jgi:hypothetical protein
MITGQSMIPWAIVNTYDPDRLRTLWVRPEPYDPTGDPSASRPSHAPPSKSIAGIPIIALASFAPMAEKSQKYPLISDNSRTLPNIPEHSLKWDHKGASHLNIRATSFLNAKKNRRTSFGFPAGVRLFCEDDRLRAIGALGTGFIPLMVPENRSFIGTLIIGLGLKSFALSGPGIPPCGRCPYRPFGRACTLRRCDHFLAWMASYR